MSYRVFIAWHWASYWVSGFLIFKTGQEHIFPRDIIRMKWDDIWRFAFELLIFSLLLLFLLLNLQTYIHKNYTAHSIICLKENCGIQNDNLKNSKVLASYFFKPPFLSLAIDVICRIWANMASLCALFWFCHSLCLSACPRHWVSWVKCVLSIHNASNTET